MRLSPAYLLLVPMLLVLLPAATPAQANDARQHLDELARANSLDIEGSKPWHLRMSFQLYKLDGRPEERGTVEEWWTSPQSRRLEIRSPSYNLTIPRDPSDASGSAPRTRERYLVRELLDQVIHPIPNYGDSTTLQITEGSRTFGKATLSCITVASPAKTPAQFCFAPGTSILRAHIDEAQFAATRNVMAKFRGIELGIDNAIAYGPSLAITGHIEKLESFQPDGKVALSTAPSELPATIPGIVVAGKAISRPQPVYPLVARIQHVSGSVVIWAIISKQGTITDPLIIASADALLSEAAIDAVKRWTYEPYLLKGAPTEVDTTITVNFNMTSNSPMIY